MASVKLEIVVEYAKDGTPTIPEAQLLEAIVDELSAKLAILLVTTDYDTYMKTIS